MEANSAKMEINWYPGHMTKAKRVMQEDMKLIDLLIELLDARLPLSSRNPDIDDLGKNKARLILLNKSDLADQKANRIWTGHFKNKGFSVLEINSRDKKDIKNIDAAVREACKEKIERDRKRGIIGRPIRAMVAGIPNVGKSTFINSYSGRASAKTGNKPGVTKGKQWIRLGKSLELLDTPGILWPKFEDWRVGLKLALTGAINDDILNIEEMALELIKILKRDYAEALEGRYNIESTGMPLDILNDIARSRHCVAKGGEYDIEKAARLLLEDFRSGRLGRITLELPEDGEF